MTIKFVNPKNPLRKTASAPAEVPAGQQTGPRTQPVGVPTPVIDKFASKKDEQNFEPQGSRGVFNPMRFGGRDASGCVTASNERMYDRAGQMNAWTNADALAQASYLLNHVTNKGPLAGLSRQASAEEREESRRSLSAALRDPSGDGFALVGQELALPIKNIIDYEGFIRKVLRVRTLAQGELFRIPKDVRATAYTVGQDGQGIESRPIGQFLLPDEALIGSWPEVDMMQIYQMNFDVLDRLQDTARQEIELEEDKRGIRLLNRCASAVNSVSTFGSMSLSVLENLRYQVERHRLIVDKFLINRAQVSDILTNLSPQVDAVTQREWNLAGYVGRFLGAHILTVAGTGGSTQEVIEDGTMYAVTSPEYLGEMGVRVELFSEPYSRLAFREAVKGYAFMEIVGFGIPNCQAVAKAVRA